MQLDAARFEDSDGYFLLTELDHFITNAQRLTGATDLGFELGRHVKMTSHDILGLGMLSCRNWDEVLLLMSRHYHPMTETFALRYRRRGAVGEAVCTPTTAMPSATLHFLTEAQTVAHWN